MIASHDEKAVAVVTGGTHGIGAAITIQLLRLGYRVIATYVENGASAEIRNSCKEQIELGAYQSIKLDYNDLDTVDGFVYDLQEMENQISVLVNNAGYSGPRDQILDFQIRSKKYLQELEKCIRVNFWGMMVACEEVGSLMAADGESCIVNIGAASAAAFKSKNLAITLSKFGAIPVTEHYASRYKGKIRVNSVNPGIIATDTVAKRENLFPSTFEAYREIMPRGEFGTAKDVADLVLYLVSKKAAYITGQHISVDGGAFL